MKIRYILLRFMIMWIVLDNIWIIGGLNFLRRRLPGVKIEEDDKEEDWKDVDDEEDSCSRWIWILKLSYSMAQHILVATIIGVI